VGHEDYCGINTSHNTINELPPVITNDTEPTPMK